MSDARLPDAFLTPGTSSFAEFVGSVSPDLLPSRRVLPAGVAVEMVRLFQTELEHYEKIEGTTLSMDGKANRLSALIRGNLGMALQGLAVVPLFAGYDLEADQGRIFSYDVTGGRYEETAFHSVGSGSLFARGSLKKLYRDDLSEADCVMAAVQALYDAADDDS